VQIPARGANDISAGQPVTVAIRPEKIYLHSAPPAANEAGVPAIVEETVYIGTDTRYTMRVAERHRVVARLQNVGSNLATVRPFRRNDQVYLSWDTDNALVLTS
jgi:ABC-type Fe3+/spermidine/putrescine transport system ATPase subunit